MFLEGDKGQRFSRPVLFAGGAVALFTDADRLRWVSDGQKVTLDVGNGRGLNCVVVAAHGLHAYVRSLAASGEYAGLEKLVAVDQLFPEITPELREKLKA